MCIGETLLRVAGSESGDFLLDMTSSRRTVLLYVDSQFISLTLQDIEYLSRMFSIVL